MKTKVRIRILLAVTLCLLVVVSANAVNARPASAQLVNENNKIWFSVTVTNYEVAFRKWRTLLWVGAHCTFATTIPPATTILSIFTPWGT